MLLSYNVPTVEMPKHQTLMTTEVAFDFAALTTIVPDIASTEPILRLDLCCITSVLMASSFATKLVFSDLSLKDLSM